MKILFDFGHPADVHYFKHLIFHLERTGNKVRVLARDKDVTFKLLKAYQIPFIAKGKGGTGLFDRMTYTVKSIRAIRKTVNDFKPDICISHASPYLAFVASTKKIPHIMFNDTEGAFLFNQVVRYLKPRVYSPDSFTEEAGKNQHTFQSYMELAYLHPDIFQMDKTVTNTSGRGYILLRFVANKATHDIGHEHLENDYKRELVHTLARHTDIKISSEDSLPKDLLPYQLDVHPSKIHDVIAGASLMVSEGATMCSEAAMLGIPSIFINQNKLGYITELDKKYELIDHFMADQKGRKQALERALALLKDPDLAEKYDQRRDRMLRDKKNLTKLMISILEETASEIGAGQIGRKTDR